VSAQEIPRCAHLGFIDRGPISATAEIAQCLSAATSSNVKLSEAVLARRIAAQTASCSRSPSAKSVPSRRRSSSLSSRARSRADRALIAATHHSQGVPHRAAPDQSLAVRSHRPWLHKKRRQITQRFQRDDEIESFLTWNPPNQVALKAPIESFSKYREQRNQ
jgi:hypothetical protein